MERKNVDLLRVFHFFHRVFHIRQVERYKLWEDFRHFTICILKKIFFTIRSLTFDARGTARILSRFASAHRGSLSLPSEEAKSLPLGGDSPSRGNVTKHICWCDKRVSLSAERGGFAVGKDGWGVYVQHSSLIRLPENESINFIRDGDRCEG